MLGLFEPVCAPWKVEGIPDDFSFGSIPPDWDRMGPYVEKAMRRVPDHVGDRHPDVLLRAGELHARPAARGRRGARAAELLRGRRPQLHRHPHRRRAGPGPGPLDHDRPARRRRDRVQHRPPAPLPDQPGVPRRPARSSPSASSTSATTRTGRCRPPAAPSARPCTTGWPTAGARFRTSAAGKARTGTCPAGASPVAQTLTWGTAAVVPATGRPSTRRPATA